MAKRGKSQAVTLGQEVFVVTGTDGGIERTMVGALEGKEYILLNGQSCGLATHWFSLDLAIEAAAEQIKSREALLRAELRNLARRRKHILSIEYQAAVLDSPYKVADLRAEGRAVRSRRIRTVTVPSEYLCPGCRVYTIITPQTRVRWEEVYRPHPHFVLETEVRRVHFSPDGVVHYTFVTPFVVSEFFLDKDAAIRTLSNYSEPGTLETVPFVSLEEEQQALLVDDLPF